MVASFFIMTNSSIRTWSTVAFISIGTSSVRVAFIPCHTHTPGRIAGCTFSIDTTSESFTRAFAFLSISNVQVKRWWTYTFPRLYTFFIRKTIRITDAALLVQRAMAGHRVFTIAIGTFTNERAWCVNTFSSKSTNRLAGYAFVCVFTRAIDRLREPSGACAIAHSI